MRSPASFSHDEIIEVRAKPNSSKSVLVWDDEKKKMNAFLHSIAEGGKANSELVKLFWKQLKIRVELVSGARSRNKKVKVLYSKTRTFL